MKLKATYFALVCCISILGGSNQLFAGTPATLPTDTLLTCNGALIDTPFQRMYFPYINQDQDSTTVFINTDSTYRFEFYLDMVCYDADYPGAPDSIGSPFFKIKNLKTQKTYTAGSDAETQNIYEIRNIILAGTKSVWQLMKWGECCGCSAHSLTVVETKNGFIQLAHLYDGSEGCYKDYGYIMLPICEAGNTVFRTYFAGKEQGLQWDDSEIAAQSYKHFVQTEALINEHYPKQYPKTSVFAIVNDQSDCPENTDEESSVWDDIPVYVERKAYYYYFNGQTATLVDSLDMLEY